MQFSLNILSRIWENYCRFAYQWQFRSLLACSALVLLSGCAVSRHEISKKQMISEYQQGPYEISVSAPISREIGIKLISIGENSAVIQVISSGRYVSAKKGRYFVCQEFGSKGLFLESVSARNQNIKLMRYYAGN